MRGIDFMSVVQEQLIPMRIEDKRFRLVLVDVRPVLRVGNGGVGEAKGIEEPAVKGPGWNRDPTQKG